MDRGFLFHCRMLCSSGILGISGANIAGFRDNDIAYVIGTLIVFVVAMGMLHWPVSATQAPPPPPAPPKKPSKKGWTSADDIAN